MSRAWNVKPLSPEKTALYLFGVFFIVVLLIIALAVPNPTEAQWRIFNVVLALVAAAIGGVLPGVLHLKFTPWLRAGGALGVFALVYLVKPTGLVAQDPFRPLKPPPPIALARSAVDEWLAMVDNGRFDEAYASSHSAWQRRYAKQDFMDLAHELRQPLGRVVHRYDVGQQSADAPLGDRGHVRAYGFLTQFENVSEPIQEMVYVFAGEGAEDWAAAGYVFDVEKARSKLLSTNTTQASKSAEIP